MLFLQAQVTLLSIALVIDSGSLASLSLLQINQSADSHAADYTPL